MITPIRILLIEDNPEFGRAVELVFKRTPEMELVYTTGSAERALTWLNSRQEGECPDVILLDLTLLGMSGLDALPKLRDLRPETKIIALTQSNREADVVKAISLGANGYLLKGSDLHDIKAGIQTVMDNGAPLDHQVAQYIVKMVQTDDTLSADKASCLLTERETEILNKLAQGMVKKQIADDLKISTHTVSNHVRHIYEKLKVPNGPAAVNKAFRTGILPPGKS